MLFRFCLYGFLKNQRYFEPFLVLVFLEKGLSFFAIGGLIAFREVATNVFEIPSGAIADLLGRRRSMILSFVAYLASFLVFGLTKNALWLFPAMFLFSIGDAFRTGTHKAMIFAWLRSQGRTEERTKVYGYTRSWSKLGSAVAVVLGAVFAFAFDEYSVVFLFATIPCALNIVNFLGYPIELDGEHPRKASLRDIFEHTVRALKDSIRRPALRRLIVESMGFEGVFHAAKDFLQPLLAAAAVGLVAAWSQDASLSEIQRTSLLVGPVYLLLHLASSVASRNAHRAVRMAGTETRASRMIWGVAAVLFAAILGGEWSGLVTLSIVAFVLLHVLQNVWRPILISRFDSVGEERAGATTLSIESQGRRIATMILAPLLGYATDLSVRAGAGFWPIGALGAGIAGSMWIWLRLRREPL